MRTPPSHVARSSHLRRPVTPSATERPVQKQLARAVRDLVKRRTPRGRHPAGLEIPFLRAGSTRNLERHVQTPLRPVALEVLPEVRELQRRADGVGSRVERAVAVAGHGQHEAADRIRRTPAIVEQSLPRLVSSGHDVLSKRAEQIVEQRHVEAMHGHRLGKRREDLRRIGVVVRRRSSGGRGVQTLAPVIEPGQPRLRRRASPSSAKSSAIRANA